MDGGIGGSNINIANCAGTRAQRTHAAVRHSRLVLHLSLFRQTKYLVPLFVYPSEDFPLDFHN